MTLIRSWPAPRLRRAVALIVILVMWGLLTHGTFAGSGDEPHYQMIAHSLAFDRDLDLSNDYADPANLIAHGTLAPGPHAIAGKDGRLRPAHDIGMPLIFAPYFAAAHVMAQKVSAALPAAALKRAKLTDTLLLRHLLSLAMVAITAWIAIQLFDIGLGLGARPGLAAGCALLLTLSPPLLSHSFLFFTEIVSAAISLWIFQRVRVPDLRGAHPLLAGAMVGLLLLVHARNAGLVAGLAAIGVLTLRRDTRSRRALMLFCAGLAALLVVRSAVTYHFWGTFITTPHARMGEAGAGSVMESATRLAGWLFDQEHGLFFYAPIYLLVPAGVFALYRRERTLALQALSVIALYVAVMAAPLFNPHGWRGGWSPAARFLVPVVPLLAYPLFAWLIAAGRPVLFRALAAIQIAIDILLWQQPKLLWNEGDGTSALLTHLGAGTARISDLFPAEGHWMAPMLWVAAAVMAAGWIQVRGSGDRDHR